MSDIDAANAAFWDELCGSVDAKRLGINDHTPKSLRRYDDWYLHECYPYLQQYLGFLGDLRGKTIVEFGLGYGTLGQKLAESGARYIGVDIARNPVLMMRHRLAANGLSGEVLHRSIFESGIDDCSA